MDLELDTSRFPSALLLRAYQSDLITETEQCRPKSANRRESRES